MTSYSTSEMRNGLKVLLNNEPCVIIENEFVKPGKGQGFNRIKLRHLKTGRIYDRTLKSGEHLQAANILEITVQYLYHDSEYWYFMNPQNFEQYQANHEIIGDTIKWLKEQDNCTMITWNGQPLTILPANFVTLQVTESEPSIKGDTVSGGTKPVQLKTGATLRVPLFIENGDWLKIDTRTGEYISRVSAPDA